MRQLVVYALLSVDGVAESPDRYVDDFDQEMHANLSRVMEAQDAVLLGRRTYDEWATRGRHGCPRKHRAGAFPVGSGLVDELRLVIAPFVAGAGRRLLEDEGVARMLELLRSAGTPSGAVLADYRVVNTD